MKDGGPAFPVAHNQNPAGMTLRDWLAGMAMQGLLAQSMGTAIESDRPTGAKWAYGMADAMLAQREK